jgi:hypothetical protein
MLKNNLIKLTFTLSFDLKVDLLFFYCKPFLDLFEGLTSISQKYSVKLLEPVACLRAFTGKKTNKRDETALDRSLAALAPGNR